VTQQQRLNEAIAQKLIVMHSVDFDCMVCRRNFDLTQQGRKIGPAAFVLAHLKSCLLSAGAPPPKQP
jgi:hypothetical protein